MKPCKDPFKDLRDALDKLDETLKDVKSNLKKWDKQLGVSSNDTDKRHKDKGRHKYA